MAVNQTQRPQFFEEQYLGAADLTAAVDYGRVQHARHALGAHTWGIAAGLQLTERDSPSGGGQVDVYIQPGYAWDGFGRTILVLSPRKIDPELFKAITYDAAIDGGTPPGRLIKVWLRYEEAASRQPPEGFQTCHDESQFSRIAETFRVEAGEKIDHLSLHAPVSVAGYSVDAQETLQRLDPRTPAVALVDESIPYQDLPVDPRTRWLIPLGAVRWEPNPIANQPGRFVKRTEAADLPFSRRLRRYIGSVAGAIEAADDVIRMHDRTKPYSTVVSSDLVWIEGALRVEGDARLFGGKLDFRDQNGLDNGGIPLFLRRVDVAGASGSLQAVIGTSRQGANTFAVGPLDGQTFVPRVVVLDNGKVGIGTATPSAPVHISGPANQYLDISSTDTQQSYTRLMAVTSNGRTESQLQFRNQLGFVAPLGSEGGQFVMTLLQSGNVGIGTTTAARKLHVIGDRIRLESDDASKRLDMRVDGGAVDLHSETSSLYLRSSGSGTNNRVIINPFAGDGSVGIGTEHPAGRLTLSGIVQPQQGTLTLFSQNADVEYDGGSDGTFVFRDNGGKTAFMGGKVGIGTTNPASPLHISGPGNQYLDVSSTDPQQSYTRLMAVTSNGITESQLQFAQRLSFVAPLSGNSILSVHQNGDIYVRRNAYKPGGGSWSNSSDERLKKDITTLGDALARLLKLRGVRFQYKDPDRMGGLTGPQIGFIAQDVERVFPDWVSDGPDGYKELTIRGFEALTVEALRELRARIEDVGAQSQRGGISLGHALAVEAIRELKTEIDTVKARLETMPPPQPPQPPQPAKTKKRGRSVR